MDRLFASAAFLTAAGLLGMGLLVHATQDDVVPISDLARREGQRVCVEGTLDHLRTVGEGARFAVSQTSGAVLGRASFVPNATTGDRVRVCGTVERSGTLLMLALRNPAEVRVLKRWDAEATPLERVAEEPWAFEGRRLVVWGQVHREGARTYLVDVASAARLRGQASMALPSDVSLRLQGMLEYDEDETGFRFLVEAYEEAAS